MTLDLIGYNICMHVVLEWIKWYSECFNLQAAIDGGWLHLCNMWKKIQGGGVAPPPLQNVPRPWPRSVPFGWTLSDLDNEPSTVAVPCSVCDKLHKHVFFSISLEQQVSHCWWECYFTVQLPPDLTDYNICMHVVLEWIKWSSECFNLQDATKTTVTDVPYVARNIRGRGGSTAITKSS